MNDCAEVARQSEGLIAHDRAKGRVEAVRNLAAAFQAAEARIANNPAWRPQKEGRKTRSP